MKVLLATDLKGRDREVRYPVLCSYKIDGIRAIVTKDGVMARSGKPIPNLEVQKAFRDYVGFDGELVSGEPNRERVWNKTTSVVMSKNKSADSISFHVFDYFPMEDSPYTQRLQHLNSITGLPSNVQIVNQHEIPNHIMLEYFFKDAIASGFEGVMMRSKEGLYKHGRSTFNEGILIKLKPDGEPRLARVIGINERIRGGKGGVGDGFLGSFIVQDAETKVVFELGTGISEAQRFFFYNTSIIGATLFYKCSGFMERPRFPVFVSLLDWSCYGK